MKRSFLLVIAMLAVEIAVAQDVPQQSPGWFNRYGRPSLGGHVGANMWLNDFKTSNISGGGDVFMRYGFTRKFSFGVMSEYVALQSKNGTVQAGHPALSNSYVNLKGFSFDLVGWYHFTAGKTVTPYVYAGIGKIFYQRKVQGDLGWPSDDSETSIHVPLGVGLEYALTKYTALSFEVGARIMNKTTDNYSAGLAPVLKTDWYPTARAGFAFYLGSSPDDDNDGDGLTNGYEKEIGTSPDRADTDGDGLSDYEEVMKYKTNPAVADSDGDGLSDGMEVMTHRTKPLDKDSDADGLTDGEEIAQFHTDPLKADTDGDTLSDRDEVRTHRTDPLKADTDGDTLSDAAEVRTHKTDPLKADTDAGTVADNIEIARGSNPLDAADDVPKPTVKTVEVGKAIVLEGIVFKSGKALIEPESESTLQQAYEVLAENADIAVEIRGYTDNVGNAAANKRLSLRRAEAVRAWLVQKGIAASRIAVAGLGAENPIADNTTPEGRQANRRIEFFRTK